MQQFLSSINFCLSNIGYLFILCLPVMTLEVALASLLASVDFQAGSDAAALEAIGNISGQFFILVLASLILSVALSGGCMAAFHSLTYAGSLTPYQALLQGLKKFFPLLWANILHSFAYGLGFLMLVLPGFYLYGRLGLFPLFIMFEGKGAMDSLSESWNLTEEVATKLFALLSATACLNKLNLLSYESFCFGGKLPAKGLVLLYFILSSTFFLILFNLF